MPYHLHPRVLYYKYYSVPLALLEGYAPAPFFDLRDSFEKPSS